MSVKELILICSVIIGLAIVVCSIFLYDDFYVKNTITGTVKNIEYENNTFGEDKFIVYLTDGRILAIGERYANGKLQINGTFEFGLNYRGAVRSVSEIKK